MKIVLIGSVADSVILFRGALLRRFVSLGHEVTVVTGNEKPAITAALARMGIDHETVALSRSGRNPLGDLSTALALYRACRRLRPSLVLAYTAKPVIWGGIAARLAGVPRFHALITGVGNQFPDRAVRGSGLANLLERLYRLSLGGATSVTFQNTEDRALFIERRLVPGRRTHRVNGSGVNLRHYTPTPLPASTPVFLMITRLIAAKGVREYAQAARRCREHHPELRFQLVGVEESGDGAVPLEEVQSWRNDVEFLGAVDGAREVMQRCHVYVLPSYFGEGVPRTILEAMAIGRPVLTTDNVGCRDAVVDGENGRLVAPRSVDALVEGLEWFLANRADWTRMGDDGRRKAEQRFDVELVNDAMLEILGLGTAPVADIASAFRPVQAIQEP